MWPFNLHLFRWNSWNRPFGVSIDLVKTCLKPLKNNIDLGMVYTTLIVKLGIAYYFFKILTNITSTKLQFHEWQHRCPQESRAKMLAFREQRPMLPAEIVPLLPGRLQGTNPREPQGKDMGNTCHKAVEMSKEHLRIKVWDFIWAFDDKKRSTCVWVHCYLNLDPYIICQHHELHGF